MLWILAASSLLCPGRAPAGAEMKLPVAGLKEFRVASDMQPTVWSVLQAARFPNDSKTALPIRAERENWRRLECCRFSAGASDASSALVSLL